MYRHVLHAMKMHKSSSNDQNVEDLVRLEPDVALPRQEAFWYPRPIQHSPQYVEPTHDEHPVDGGLHQGSVPARHDQEVHRGNKPKTSQTDKQESPEWSVLTGGELVHHCDDDGTNTKQRDDGEVDYFRDKLTVEPVVDPGNKAANCEETDTDIIKLTEELGYVFRVAANCVEQAGESQAQDSSKEEEEEDEFLSELYIRVAVVTEGFDIEDDGHSDKSNKPNQMSPDVSSFRVNSKYRLEAFFEGIQLWSVTKL